jgi:hypothetical protein
MITTIAKQTGQPKIRYNPNFVAEDIRNGLVRPHFKDFIRHVKNTIPQVEFFLYTGSTSEWANFIFPHVEKILGIKFNRPLFTREYCASNNGRLVKRLSNVTPHVVKRLSKKYLPVKLKGERGIQATILIDNTQGVLEETDHHVLCPTYDMQYPIDVFRQLPPSVSMNIRAHQYAQLRNDPRWKDMVTAKCSETQRFFACYYKHLAKLHYIAHKHNISINIDNDVYWKRLTKALLSSDVSRINAKYLSTLAHH